MTNWSDYILGLCFTYMFGEENINITIFKNLSDGLQGHINSMVPQYCLYTPVYVCWPF